MITENLFRVLFISLLLFMVFDCHNNPVTPPVDEAGSRDYIWTVDTINYPNSITRIWGSSPSDVWAVGPCRRFI